MAEAALIVLFSIVSFVGGTRFGVWICEHETEKFAAPDPAGTNVHMLPVRHVRGTHKTR